MNARIAALLLAATTLGGCSAGAWRDRGHDWAELFEARCTIGPGLAAHARATELLQIGASSLAEAHAVGLMEGRITVVREERSELGLSLLHQYEYRRSGSKLLDVRNPRFGDPGWERHPLSWQTEHDRQLADVGLGLHIIYVGVDATFHLGELWDAVAGLVGFDPSGDDAWNRPLEELQRQACSLDAGERRAAFDALQRRGAETHGYAIWTARDVMPPAQKLACDAVKGDLEAGAQQQPPPAEEPTPPPAGEPAGDK
jgi:hypothetical protein